MRYNPKKIEQKWQKKWLKSRIYEPDFKKARRPFYNLMMFPYPSAEGLHIGAVRTFSGVDIYGRFKRMQGYDVFEPIGLDGFGIHSENFALKVGKHPFQHAKDSEKNFYRQLGNIGNGFAWEERLETYDPEYYKWTQWIFIQMYEHGLAYRKKAAVNWCPGCKTVLADEQILQGECERCQTRVTKKDLEQWFFKITDYAERLLKNLEKIDWPEPIKIAQKNWIGRGEGALIKFKVKGEKLKVAAESLKFDLPKIPQILSGEKYITVRLRPKNLKSGDLCELIDSTTGKKFALAEILKVEKRELKEVPDRGRGLQTFKSRAEFYKVLSKYYGVKADDYTDSWLYHFRLVDESIEAFTTRPDTLFGATYMVLAPEHQLIEDYKLQITNYREVEDYVKKARAKTEEERIAEGKEKTGVELKGIKAINPATKEEIPIWAADYVLGQVGTGAVMAVPAHDQRDFEFAQKYNLPIKIVICSHYPQKTCPILDKAYEGEGHLVGSGQFDGLSSEKAKREITKFVGGKRRMQYRLRDWLISRQRYWGAPIPMVYCEKCKESSSGSRTSRWPSPAEATSARAGGKSDFQKFSRGELENPGWIAVPEKDLPVRLPYIKNFRPTGTEKSPLAMVEKFYKIKCPKCKSWARRETDVSDTFLDSAWYYLRYPSVKDSRYPWNPAATKKWFPVDMYIGGAEHAVLHLLYVRFLAMALHDRGLIRFEEPFRKFRTHGLITKDGFKMSKSRGNVVNPDEYINAYGIDAIRMYLAFMAPLDQGGDFRDEGIRGITRFLEKVWRFVVQKSTKHKIQNTNKTQSTKHRIQTAERRLHKTIKKVTEDIEGLQYNTAISALMILLNEFETNANAVTEDDIKTFLRLLAPFAPFITEELYSLFVIRHSSFRSIHLEPWPKYDPRLIPEETFELAIQVNGKVRGRATLPIGATKEGAARAALNMESVKRYVKTEPRQIIFVPNRLINFVI